MKSSYIFLAPGFEETEALTVVDILRRAGMEVVTVAVNDDVKVEGAHGVPVVADVLFSDVNISDPEWLICPGGMPGATNLADNSDLGTLLTDTFGRGGKIAAICAAPAVVLAPLGILDGRDATCYPGFEQLCPRAVMHDTPVVVSDNLITGNGPAAAMRFALAIVRSSMGESAAREIGQGLLYYPSAMNFYF